MKKKVTVPANAAHLEQRLLPCIHSRSKDVLEMVCAPEGCHLHHAMAGWLWRFEKNALAHKAYLTLVNLAYRKLTQQPKKKTCNTS